MWVSYMCQSRTHHRGYGERCRGGAGGTGRSNMKVSGRHKAISGTAGQVRG